MKILIVTKNWLGDILFQIPAIETIHRQYPEAEIVCMSPNRCKEILEAHPAVKRVLVFDEKKEHRSFFGRWAFAWRIRNERFDRVYLFHDSRTRAALVWLAGIPVRIGFAGNRRVFLTRAIKEPQRKMHQVDYFLCAVEESEGLAHETKPYHFYFSPQDAESAKRKTKSLPGSSYVCFHLGANWEPKRWPVTHFAKLADLIHQRWGLPVIVTGGAQDVPLAETLKREIRQAQVMILAGCTTLGELGAIFKNSLFVVSGDSGPMHIASGVGTSVAALFGPTDPDGTGPRGTGKILILRFVPEGFQVPWYGEEKDFPKEGWLSHIQPEEVIRAIEKQHWVSSAVPYVL